MKADQLMRRFVRETGRLVEVRTATPNSAASESEWSAFDVLSEDPTHAEIEAVKKRALADPRYFTRCGECGEFHPVGLMHQNSVCEACAEGTLGVHHGDPKPIGG